MLNVRMHAAVAEQSEEMQLARPSTLHSLLKQRHVLHCLLAISKSIRVMSMCTIRPAAMFMCPTSLLPICPSGNPTKGPDRMNQSVGEFLEQLS